MCGKQVYLRIGKEYQLQSTILWPSTEKNSNMQCEHYCFLPSSNLGGIFAKILCSRFSSYNYLVQAMLEFLKYNCHSLLDFNNFLLDIFFIYISNAILKVPYTYLLPCSPSHPLLTNNFLTSYHVLSSRNIFGLCL